MQCYMLSVLTGFIMLVVNKLVIDVFLLLSELVKLHDNQKTDGRVNIL